MTEGAVEVVRHGVRIAEIAEPGAVFGDLAALLDQPHSAHVRALQPSTFYVADGRTILRVDPLVTLYGVPDAISRPSTATWLKPKGDWRRPISRVAFYA
jgi:CRP-like cAMP-binding protein